MLPRVRFVVGLGSSDHHAASRVREGAARLGAHPMLSVVAASRLYESPAAGGATAARFVNAAVVVDTALPAAALLQALHAIEAACGRVRAMANASRTLDLDVLWSVDAPLVDGDAPQGAGPAVPHPRLFERAFAAVPALEALGNAGLPVPSPLADAARALARQPLAALPGLLAPAGQPIERG